MQKEIIKIIYNTDEKLVSQIKADYIFNMLFKGITDQDMLRKGKESIYNSLGLVVK